MLEIDNRAIELIASKILEVYRSQLKQQGMRGSLADESKINVQDVGNKLVIELEVPLYGLVVEDGRKPYPNQPDKRPPVTAIHNWIIDKGIRPDPRNGKVPDTKSLAFAISHSIGERGIVGKAPVKNMRLRSDYADVIHLIKEEIKRQIHEHVMNL